MRILLTGGAGFIASHIAEVYLQEGHQVSIVDNLSQGKRENVPPGATFHHMDIQDPQLDEVFSKERPEVINHHAAQIDVRKMERCFPPPQSRGAPAELYGHLPCP